MHHPPQLPPLALPSPQMGTNPSPQLIPTPASPYHTAGHFGLASGHSRNHSGGSSGPAQPIGQLGPPGSFLNPMSVNTNPLGSASLWRPNGNPIGSMTMPLSPDSSELFTVGDQAFTPAPTGFNIRGTALFQVAKLLQSLALLSSWMVPRTYKSAQRLSI